ncbi:MAG: ABC transporter ATP-binding protein [Lentisphaerales bacterium]|jgi:ABC-2 type transport system ATP-binding protein|nr:MAG: ABC transporter ATP-binding protein [Lentisphaerales bacterium]
MKDAIAISDLFVRYYARGKHVEALQGLSLTVPTGSVVGFLGPNGAGKTTAIHVLLGFIEPTSGSARVLGCDVGGRIARQRIGYLPEHPETYRFLTGRELLGMAGRLFLMERRLLRRRIDDLLAKLDLAHAADRRIGTYSRGMMQRIGLAQALINDPELVILDEPTGGLDPLGRMKVRSLISDLRETGKTVFFSSHELSEVELVCDHIVMISNGKLVAEGKVLDLVQNGESLEKYFLRVMAE